jgi:hypothetical protein
MQNTALHALNAVVLPQVHDSPPSPAKSNIFPLIPTTVLGDLQVPPVAIACSTRKAPRTSMPEAAINEYHQTPLMNYEVRPSWETRRLFTVRDAVSA